MCEVAFDDTNKHNQLGQERSAAEITYNEFARAERNLLPCDVTFRGLANLLTLGW